MPCEERRHQPGQDRVTAAVRRRSIGEVWLMLAGIVAAMAWHPGAHLLHSRVPLPELLQILIVPRRG